MQRKLQKRSHDRRNLLTQLPISWWTIALTHTLSTFISTYLYHTYLPLLLISLPASLLLSTYIPLSLYLHTPLSLCIYLHGLLHKCKHVKFSFSYSFVKYIPTYYVPCLNHRYIHCIYYLCHLLLYRFVCITHKDLHSLYIPCLGTHYLNSKTLALPLSLSLTHNISLSLKYSFPSQTSIKEKHSLTL